MLFMDLINDLYVLMLPEEWAMMGGIGGRSLLQEPLRQRSQSLFEEGGRNAIPAGADR